MKPNFDPVDENHEFNEGEEVYLIDNNKIDIFKAKIEKVNKKGFSVLITDHGEGSSKKVLSPKRLLLLTPTNNEIYEQQQQLRKQSVEMDQQEKIEEKLKEHLNIKGEEEEKGEEETKEENENNNENDAELKGEEKEIEKQIEEIKSKSTSKKIKRRKKVKKPLFDQQMIIKTAWHNGIHEVTQFKKYIKRNVKLLVSEFEKYHIMMNVADEPPFSLGINLEDSDITKFWSMARNQWKKLFEDAEAVNTDEFIKKSASLYKLQNQMESNAREALRFFFDTENGSNETNFFQFCALLALFGPTQTMFRKIGHFLQCPPCLKDSFTYNDVNDINEPDENVYLNEFVFFAGSSNEKYVYNLPFATTDEPYIVDEEGNKYDSWLKVFEQVISQKVEEETTTIDTPPEIPVEAS